MSVVKPRDVSPIIQAFRNFLLGRKHNKALRFEMDLAPRTTDPPNLPEGPAHILSANYYYSRDARREVFPPILLAAPSVSGTITAGIKEDTAPTTKKSKIPGKVYHWD